MQDNVSLRPFGVGRYYPSVLSFFPKLARGHSNRKSSPCPSENCGAKSNPHVGGNLAHWKSERGVK